MSRTHQTVNINHDLYDFNKQKKTQYYGKTSQIILLGFLAVIMVGTLLLTLPIATVTGESASFLTALFTATSATCVTGLVVETTATYWSNFGQLVILILIQIGGLGFMAVMTMIYIIAKRRITLKERLVIQESFNVQSIYGLVKLAKLAVVGTIIFELIGAFLLFLIFYIKYGFGFLQSIYYGVFHSISAFCNAGFDILGGSSLMAYRGDWLLNIVIISLIIIGGIGFAVWSNIYEIRNIKYANGRKMTIIEKMQRLKLHTKIAIAVSLLLIVTGTVLFFLFEFNNPATIGDLSLEEKFLTSLFHSTSLRTAGFNTIPIGSMTDTSIFLSTIFMLIGGSPGSTAGGMKTVTFAVIIFVVISVLKGETETKAFNKSIAPSLYRKALALGMVYLSIFIVATVLLLTVEQNSGNNVDFLAISFEVASALGTVGLSTGITSSLTDIGKFIIIICMYIGRLGPITVAVSITATQKTNRNIISHPEENVIVG